MRWISDQTYHPRYPLWTRANVGEVLPDAPSPLGWDFLWEHNRQGWRDTLVGLLGFDEDEVDAINPEVISVWGGYAYLSATANRIWGERTPGFSAELIDAAYFAGHPDVPPYVAEPWHENARTTEVMTQTLGWIMGTMQQDKLEADRLVSRDIRASRPDFSAATDGEVLAHARSLQPVCRSMFAQHIAQSAAASIGPGVLGAICAAVGKPEATLVLFAGLGGVDSAAPSYAMWSLSRSVAASTILTAAFDQGVDGLNDRLRNDSAHADFMAEFDAFLADFGSRGPNEWDLASEAWETKPDIALAAVDRMRLAGDGSDPASSNTDRAVERLNATAEIEAILAADPATLGQFRAASASAATFVPGRERSKTNVIRVVGEMRLALRELGARAASRGDLANAHDVFMLFDDELDSLIQGKLAGADELVVERRAHHAWLKSLEPPFVFNGEAPSNTTWPRRDSKSVAESAPGTVLQGMPGCPGVARGIARVILDPSDPGALGVGEILVAPMTDPAWTPLFVSAAAVVVDVGAALSHAIIVSRELGIPCVVSVTGATRSIRDGAEIEVDGASGTVTILS